MAKKKPSTDLMPLDELETFLAETKDLTEVLNLGRRCDLAAAWAKSNASVKAANAIMLKGLMCHRKVGELLIEIEKSGHRSKGGRPSKNPLQPGEGFTAADLGVDNHSFRLKTLVELSPAEVKAYVKECDEHEKGPQNATKSEAIKRAMRLKQRSSHSTRKPKAPKGKYDVIVIDPPWPMEKIEREVRPNQQEMDYPTMTEDELEHFGKEILKPAMHTNCHVWVWTTHKFLPMSLRLIAKWGLKYVCTFVWHKPGGFQPVGLPQYNCEFALYARKGSPEFKSTKAFPVCFNAKRGKHSEKPTEFYDMVAKVTDGKRLDMFNRRELKGFEAWGNE